MQLIAITQIGLGLKRDCPNYRTREIQPLFREPVFTKVTHLAHRPISASLSRSPQKWRRISLCTPVDYKSRLRKRGRVKIMCNVITINANSTDEARKNAATQPGIGLGVFQNWISLRENPSSHTPNPYFLTSGNTPRKINIR